MTTHDPALVRRQLLKIVRDDFRYFVWQVFKTLHQGDEAEFEPGWHIEAMCHELEEVRAGRNTRLVINIPPRCLKSITVAVAYCAFLLGHRPETKIIVASYGLDLARKHSEDCRKVMTAGWYRIIFPDTKLTKRGTTIEEILTTKGGSRKAVSIGSSVTGHGADYIIIDDLLKGMDATSDAELIKAQEFIEGTLLSRFDRPSDGKVVMVAQRLHELDPPGYLLEKGTYRHLNLPAIAEEEEVIQLWGGKTHRRKVRDLLSPGRLDKETLDRLHLEMGSATFNCQYQQNPIAPDGSPLRWEWFGTYAKPPARERCELLVQSWDVGTSADPRSDFSVCTTWGFAVGHWHLLDVWRDRVDYPGLKAKALALLHQWNPDKVLIEDAVSGRALLQELRIDHSNAIAMTPDQNKEIRFQSACSLVEEGKVRLPIDAPWLQAFKRELQSFPRGRHDDQVDSFGQMMNWAKGRGFYRSLGRGHPINAERQRRSMEERERNRPDRIRPDPARPR